MLAKKALRWLDGVQARPAGGGPWMQAAEALVHEANA